MAGVIISSGFQEAHVFGQLIMVCPAQVGIKEETFFKEDLEDKDPKTCLQAGYSH